MTRTGIADRLFPTLVRGLVNARTLVLGHGFARSVREQMPVDAAGAPLPWYTYPAIEYLGQFDFHARSVFEYGAGNSSRFWAARARRVCSVESDPRWHAKLTARDPALRIDLCREKDDYVACPARVQPPFDVIVIDGSWRHACARTAPSHLAAGGMIVLDNCDRHPRSARALRDAGFLQVDFSGFGPVNPYAWTTSIFVRAERGLQQGFRDPRPIGGIVRNDPEDD